MHLIDDFAARHHGLIHKDAALRLGFSRTNWYRAIGPGGALEALYPNVARVWGSPASFEQRVLGAVWAAGPGAMASHRSAAALWGVHRPEGEPLDVILPSRGRHSLPGGVVIHRPSDRLDLRPVLRRRIPVTNPMRMLLDLGAVDPDSVFDALVDVLSAKVASPHAIRSTLYRHSTKGRHGTVALRAALERWLDEELPPDSTLEAVMGDLVRDFALPPMTFHAIVEGYEVDFLVTGTRVIVECDGWGSHGLDRDQFEFDRLRDADLVGAGWHVVHVTWRQVTQQPAVAAARIRRVIDQWAR